MSVNVTLTDPNGNEWVAGSAIEVNDLLAQGYRIKGHGTAGDQGDPALSSGEEAPHNAPSNVVDPNPVTNTGDVQPSGDGSGQ